VSRARTGAALVAAGVLLLAAAAGAIAYPWWWTQRQRVVARNLVASGAAPVESPPAPAAADGGSCPRAPRAPRAAEATGVLVVPAIGLVAPVLEGLSDSVLDVAVGHDPASPLPGVAGEAILEAHDVSYFSALDRLRPGEEVIWATGCRRLVFRTLATTVSEPGVTVPTPPSGFGLALVTCWPTNALWWTPDRFVVETTLSSVSNAAKPRQAPEVTPVHLVVPAPAALVRQGLGLNENPVVLGTLQVTGSPTTAWRLGPGPLDAARVGLEAYFALRRTVEAQNRSWWSQLALPGVRLPTSWSDAGVVNTIVRAQGEQVVAVDLVSSGESVVLAVHGHDLLASAVAG
jgi:sortase (surface protein transpeptidase)